MAVVIPYVKQTHTISGTWTAAKANVVEDGTNDAHYMSCARAFHNANQSITTSTWTSLALNSERFDQAGNVASTIHDLATNNSRLTCRHAGVYLITGTFQFASNATGSYRLGRILHQGTTEITKASSDRGVEAWVTCTTMFVLAVNEYVELQAFQDSGAGLNVMALPAISPEFSMVRVG